MATYAWIDVYTADANHEYHFAEPIVVPNTPGERPCGWHSRIRSQSHTADSRCRCCVSGSCIHEPRGEAAPPAQQPSERTARAADIPRHRGDRCQHGAWKQHRSLRLNGVYNDHPQNTRVWIRNVPLRLYFSLGCEDRVAIFEDHFELTPSSERPERMFGFYLMYERDLLRLCHADDGKGVSITAAEISKRATHDLELARACGVRHGPSRCTVLDVMAGWGIDGLTLQRLGCDVTCLEQSAVAWAMLHNLIERLGVNEVKLHHTDAWCWLEQSREIFDVVYLDPMFPERRKKALPGKRIQYLAQVVSGLEHDLSDWISKARSLATSRVVLKRRLRDPEIGNPDWRIVGRSVRYDVYRCVG